MASSSNELKPKMASMNDFTHNLQQQNMDQSEKKPSQVDSKTDNNNNNEEEEEELTWTDRWNEQTPTTKYTVIGALLALFASIFVVSFGVRVKLICLSDA